MTSEASELQGTTTLPLLHLPAYSHHQLHHEEVCERTLQVFVLLEQTVTRHIEQKTALANSVVSIQMEIKFDGKICMHAHIHTHQCIYICICVLWKSVPVIFYVKKKIENVTLRTLFFIFLCVLKFTTYFSTNGSNSSRRHWPGGGLFLNISTLPPLFRCGPWDCLQ